MAERFDTIIVGAGSAGCVLAYRLSEDPRRRVLLIEAGPSDRSPWLHMPRGFGRTLLDPRLTWYFPTEPEAGNNGRRYVWVRGKTLGGSSSVNGMIYVRGQPSDFDAWEALGNRGWNWASMLRAYRELERHELGADEFRGGDGPLHVTIQRRPSPWSEAVFEAAEALGVPRKEDLNRPDLEGIGYTPCTIWKGRRMSAAVAFLRPARQRANLHIVTDTQVDRIGFEKGRARSVQAVRAGEARTFTADGDIILSAGTLQSPRILLLSGLGPASYLRSIGVAVACDSPGVGANLREHKLVTIQHRLRRPYSYNHAFTGLPSLWNTLRYFVRRSGVLADTFDLNAFVRTRPELPGPDVQLTISACSLVAGSAIPKFDRFPGMQVFGYPLLTESVGSLRIRSADPGAPLEIRANHLATPGDREATLRTFRFMRRLLSQAPLSGLLAGETQPGSEVQSDAEILDACARDHSCAHAVGTCRMGADPLAVVDDRLRVHGVEGLRVVDLSVFPTQVSGNTNGPAMALAWRAAELIAPELTLRPPVAL